MEIEGCEGWESFQFCFYSIFSKWFTQLREHPSNPTVGPFSTKFPGNFIGLIKLLLIIRIVILDCVFFLENCRNKKNWIILDLVIPATSKPRLTILLCSDARKHLDLAVHIFSKFSWKVPPLVLVLCYREPLGCIKKASSPDHFIVTPKDSQNPPELLI